MDRNAADLTIAIEQATRLAVQKLFVEHPEDFYYVSLVTSGEAHAPFLTAWSKQALATEAVIQGVSSTILKWSYADSPYCCYGEEFFDDVRRLFKERPQWVNDRPGRDWSAEFDFRLAAMEVAMLRLSEQGLFGTGAERDRLVIAVEVMPPDPSNTLRMMRLNPRNALAEWLSEAGEG